ncbi:hypothetical protein DICVIV_09213 [Dictyocaulus viviparus]|uniref:Uncharacterized protein n=1 Tax=Dictyocaulus viviparus TaxID=29172 RepID=A0A0D8XLU7_DICVI|nr:hypothetical protein DICVIV_09213 [Dictyocaulus viviparus]
MLDSFVVARRIRFQNFMKLVIVTQYGHITKKGGVRVKLELVFRRTKDCLFINVTYNNGCVERQLFDLCRITNFLSERLS